MPTIIALDVSLSMTRAVPVAATNGTNDENITYSQLAIQGINEFLNYLTKNSKLEHVSLVSIHNLSHSMHLMRKLCHQIHDMLINNMSFFSDYR